MVGPNQETNQGNGQAGHSNPLVAKQWLATKDGQQFTYNTQTGQDENVYRRV